MLVTPQQIRKPFHETIVRAIDGINSPGESFRLARLIVDTVIPENHDAIIVAWERKHFHDVNSGVVKSLLEQKAAHDAKAATATIEVNVEDQESIPDKPPYEGLPIDPSDDVE